MTNRSMSEIKYSHGEINVSWKFILAVADGGLPINIVRENANYT